MRDFAFSPNIIREFRFVLHPKPYAASNDSRSKKMAERSKREDKLLETAAEGAEGGSTPLRAGRTSPQGGVRKGKGQGRTARPQEGGQGR